MPPRYNPVPDNDRIESQPLNTEKDDRLSEDSSQYGHNHAEISQTWTANLKRIFLNTHVLLIAYGVLNLSVLFLTYRHSNYRMKGDKALFSPAEDVVELQTVTFHTGLGVDRAKFRTEFVGPPSESVDRAWENLYNEFGINRVDEETAKKFARPTLPIPGDESHYITSLDVFHQLHCLNILRQHVYPDVYHRFEGLTGNKLLVERLHIDHCLNSLRQSLQCSADITPVSWKWNEEEQVAYPSAANRHTCRNFEAIKMWAQEHRLNEKGFNSSDFPMRHGE